MNVKQSKNPFEITLTLLTWLIVIVLWFIFTNVGEMSSLLLPSPKWCGRHL